MSPRQRRTAIAESIRAEGALRVEALAARFAVSPETIRRDLARLADEGAVRRLHGFGAPPRLAVEAAYADRLDQNARAKRALAAKLASAVAPGETLFIDTGSTTLACAEALAATPGLTVVTNSTRVAEAVARGAGGAAVYLVGGRYAPGEGRTLGPLAIAQIGRFRADRAVLAAAALDAEAGAADADCDEAQVARAMIDAAEQVAVVADSSKFGRKAAFRVCALDEIDLLVTEAPPAPPLGAALARAGVAVL